jgi:CRISPR-associated protein Csm3
MTTIRLIKKLIYKGTLTLKTGLHIGGTNAELNIGGPDNFVVRNPMNNVPYIPGSSLKGKMRALVEWANGESENGGPSTNPQSKAGALFGTAGDKENAHPSRIIVRDAEMDTTVGNFSNTDLYLTESKTEVNIDRITAKANPRTFERVPAGAQFKVNFVINIFNDDDENSLVDTFKNAIILLENDYLGGHGSRGYGQVEFDIDFDHPEVLTY